MVEWFRKQQGEMVEIKTSDCPFFHAGKVIAAHRDYAELLIDGEKTGIAYEFLNMFRLVPSPPMAKGEHLFHLLHPTPKCCGEDMTMEGNLSLHCLGYKCRRCPNYLQITVTMTEGRPDMKPGVLSGIDETP